MPIDASMYLNQQATPDIMGSIMSGMKMRDMVQQQQIRQRGLNTQNAINNAIVQDPTTGQLTFDPSRMGDLGNVDKMQLLGAQAQMRQQQQAARQAQMQSLQANLKIRGQILGSVDPKTGDGWEDARSKLHAYGLDDGLPADFDPNKFQSMLGESQTYEERLANAFKSKDTNIKQQQADADTLKGRAAMADAAAKAREVAGKYPNPVQVGNVDPTTDPAMLVPGRVPEHDRDKVYSEIKDLQNVKSIASPSLDAFDQAAKEIRPLSGGIGGTSLTAFVPGMESPGQKAWQGMANTTVKDVEGTARQAAFDSLEKNYKPQFGDSDATIAQKRAGWINYLKSHSAAPTAKANGIDLQKFTSTALSPEMMAGGKTQAAKTASSSPASHPQAGQALAWAKANPNDPRAQKIMSLFVGAK